MPLHRTVLAPTLILLGLGGVGCRSTATDVPSPAVTTPVEIVQDSPTADSIATETHDVTEAVPEVVGDVSPAESELSAQRIEEEDAFDAELIESEPEEPASEPEELQRWALELCQSAEQMLEDGDAEGALSALDQAYDLMLQLPANGDGEYLQAKEDIRLLVADLIRRHYDAGRSPTTTRSTASWDLEMPMVDNEYVRREIKSFTNGERQSFIDGYRRSGRYRPMILAKLEEAGLPSQLSWLPMVESWFKTRAYSRASAVGMWQFISSTGLRYGMTRDAWIDERYDPVKSTDAAIGYLTDLHGMFGDWPKALAGYNCGEARVARLTRRSKTDYLDFWDLYELLPRETRRYVPRLYAALAIIEDPEKYGMKLPEPDPSYADLTAVGVERAVRLESLDKLLELDRGTIAELNPELRHKATPPHRYELRVPADRQETLLASLDSVPAYKPTQNQNATHRVRSGQTLSTIARRYGTSVRAVMQANNLRSAHRIYVGQTLRIPGRGGSVARVSASAVGGVHTVRRGENLGAIARAYGTSVGKLKADNGLSSNLIHPGQRLRVATASGGSGSSGTSYTVRRGDTPSGIADRHGVGLSALLRANKLGRRSTIYPGQKLVIP